MLDGPQKSQEYFELKAAQVPDRHPPKGTYLLNIFRSRFSPPLGSRSWGRQSWRRAGVLAGFPGPPAVAIRYASSKNQSQPVGWLVGKLPAPQVATHPINVPSPAAASQAALRTINTWEPEIAVAVCAAHVMDHTQVIADLQAELETQKQHTAALHGELERRARELAEARQRIELRNLSLERLQSQFTLAAEALNKLLAEREKIRQCVWAKLGITLRLLPKLEDDLR